MLRLKMKNEKKNYEVEAQLPKASGNDQAKTEFLPYALDSSTYSRQFYEQAVCPLLPPTTFRLALESQL